MKVKIIDEGLEKEINVRSLLITENVKLSDLLLRVQKLEKENKQIKEQQEKKDKELLAVWRKIR